MADSKYNKVHVLLLFWDNNDLFGLENEVHQLATVFSEDYGFSVEAWAIPYCAAAENRVTAKLNDLDEATGPNDLVILYYGGHGGRSGPEGNSCAWAARRNAQFTVEWNSMAGLLSRGSYDVLLLFDCCYASTAASPFGGLSNNGANWLLAASGTNTEAEGVSPFSFTSNTIRVLIHMRHLFLQTGSSFSVEDLHTNLHIHHYHTMTTNAVLVRLNGHSCAPQHSCKPQRPCDPIDLTPIIFEQLPAPEGGWEPVNDVVVAKMPVKANDWYLEPFLFSQQPAELDIVLVPGGNGDSISSFSSGDFMWPRDLLCRVLKRQGKIPRLLAFGFRTTGNSSFSVLEFKQYSQALVNALSRAREDCPKRSLVFVGYATGCTIIRRVIDVLYGSSDHNQSRPKIVCIFCGPNSHWAEVYLRKIRPGSQASQESLVESTLTIDRKRPGQATEHQRKSPRPQAGGGRARSNSEAQTGKSQTTLRSLGRPLSSDLGNLSVSQNRVGRHGRVSGEHLGIPSDSDNMGSSQRERSGFDRRSPALSPNSSPHSRERHHHRSKSGDDRGYHRPQAAERGRDGIDVTAAKEQYAAFLPNLNRAMAHSSETNGLRLAKMLDAVRALDRGDEWPQRSSGEGLDYTWTSYGP